MTSQRKIKWTEQQARAIAARGRSVLVTASAGTGKTAVLSGRAVNIVSDAALCPDVLNLLVLTFTEAAAEEMRSRIGLQLRDAYRQTRDARLSSQLVLLQGADISTIHAFCKRLISEHFYELSVDPALRIIDADEAMLLKAEVLDETIVWAWRQETLVPALRQLLRRRDLRETGGFLAGVIRLHGFLEGVVSRDRWCHVAEHLAEVADPLATELGEAQKRIVVERLDAILARLHHAQRLYEDEEPGGKWGATLQTNIIDPIAQCRDRLGAGDWHGAVESIGNFEKTKAPALRGFPKELGDLIKKLRTRALDQFIGLRDLAVVNPDYMSVVGRSVGPQSRVLVELVRRFSRAYAQRKAALTGLDFADLEHHALRLLATEADDGNMQPSETALALRRRYRYIFVDEYQDINPVQQAILDALSAGDNVFVVGDVKQSIYAWRGAEPTIFLDRLEASSASKDPAGGLRVDLNLNFRSAKGILDFVNKVFGRIMTEPLARMDYDEAARLRPSAAVSQGAAPVQEGSPVVEFHVLDEKAEMQANQHDDGAEGETDDGVDLVRPRQRQAALVARRIREIVGAEPGRAAMQVYDKDAGGLRDVQYRDIVVLMRSLTKKANDYVEVLRLAGIPVSSDATAGYFETTEIGDVLCLLKVLDNPQRDIELAAVLRSPFFGFSETELAEIRLAGRAQAPQANFYTCADLCRGSKTESTLRAKLARCFARLDEWRRLARRGLLADLLWRIYRDTQYVAFVCALPNGQGRKANLLKLHDRAVQFEGFASSTGVPSLTRFVTFIEKLQETGQDWAPAEPAAAAGNAVRILSVHKSKGLEFPVVFLAELESQFNRRDAQADLVMDAEHALGLQIIDPASNTKLRSLAHQVIAEKRNAVALAEEMRVLYVALTRAKDHLILTASQKRTDCGTILRKGVLLSDATLPDWLLKECKNPLEWLLYGLADQRPLHEAFETGLGDRVDDEALFALTVHGVAELGVLSNDVQRLRDRGTGPGAKPESQPRSTARGHQLLAQVEERLNWQYRFGDAVRQPAKQSVTALTHRDDEFARLDFSRALDRQPIALTAATAESVPPYSARAAGTAVHLVIANLDLKKLVTRGAIEQTVAELVARRAMTAAVAQAIDTDAILSFFGSELGSVVLDRDNTVWREWPFTLGVPVAQIHDVPEQPGGSADDIVVVQGIIDLLVRTPEGLLVIDFKSDRISGKAIAARAEAYRGQLEMYARAAGQILDVPVRRKWLYFLAPRQAVGV